MHTAPINKKQIIASYIIMFICCAITFAVHTCVFSPLFPYEMPVNHGGYTTFSFTALPAIFFTTKIVSAFLQRFNKQPNKLSVGSNIGILVLSVVSLLWCLAVQKTVQSYINSAYSADARPTTLFRAFNVLCFTFSILDIALYGRDVAKEIIKQVKVTKPCKQISKYQKQSKTNNMSDVKKRTIADAVIIGLCCAVTFVICILIFNPLFPFEVPTGGRFPTNQLSAYSLPYLFLTIKIACTALAHLRKQKDAVHLDVSAFGFAVPLFALCVWAAGGSAKIQEYINGAYGVAVRPEALFIAFNISLLTVCVLDIVLYGKEIINAIKAP